MRVKLDENLPISLVDRLAKRGIDAQTVVGEGLGGRSDTELLEVAVAEGRLIMTLDRGFGDIRRYPPGSHPGIVIFRLDDQSAPAATAAVDDLVQYHDLDDLAATITVVQRGVLRIRRPTS